MDTKILYLIQYSSNKIRLSVGNPTDEIKLVKKLADCLYSNDTHSDVPVIQDILDTIGLGSEFYCDVIEKEDFANKILEIYT